VDWNWQGKTEVLEKKPVPVPLCPPQIPHGLTRDRTRATAVRGRSLSHGTAFWVLALCLADWEPDLTTTGQVQQQPHLYWIVLAWTKNKLYVLNFFLNPSSTIDPDCVPPHFIFTAHCHMYSFWCCSLSKRILRHTFFQGTTLWIRLLYSALAVYRKTRNPLRIVKTKYGTHTGLLSPAKG
jgi:hypothetical protein